MLKKRSKNPNQLHSNLYKIYKMKNWLRFKSAVQICGEIQYVNSNSMKIYISVRLEEEAANQWMIHDASITWFDPAVSFVCEAWYSNDNEFGSDEVVESIKWTVAAWIFVALLAECLTLPFFTSINSFEFDCSHVNWVCLLFACSSIFTDNDDDESDDFDVDGTDIGPPCFSWLSVWCNGDCWWQQLLWRRIDNNGCMNVWKNEMLRKDTIYGTKRICWFCFHKIRKDNQRKINYSVHESI